MPLNFLALSSFGFSMVHCFFFLSLGCFWHTGPIFGPQTIRSGSCLNFCKPHPGPHVSFRRSFFQHCELRESCPWVWQTSIHINVPITIDSAFLRRTQGRTCSPGHVNMFQMTTDVLPFDGPKNRYWLQMSSVISSVGWDLSKLPWRSLLSSSLLTGCLALKWIFGFHDLCQTIWLFHLRLGRWKFHQFSVLSLPLHWVIEHGFPTRPNFPAQCMRPKCLLSKFFPHTTHVCCFFCVPCFLFMSWFFSFFQFFLSLLFCVFCFFGRFFHVFMSWFFLFFVYWLFTFSAFVHVLIFHICFHFLCVLIFPCSHFSQNRKLLTPRHSPPNRAQPPNHPTHHPNTRPITPPKGGAARPPEEGGTNNHRGPGREGTPAEVEEGAKAQPEAVECVPPPKGEGGSEPPLKELEVEEGNHHPRGKRKGGGANPTTQHPTQTPTQHPNTRPNTPVFSVPFLLVVGVGPAFSGCGCWPHQEKEEKMKKM